MTANPAQSSIAIAGSCRANENKKNLFVSVKVSRCNLKTSK